MAAAAAAAPADATGAASCTVVSPAKAYVSYATTVVFSNLGVTSLKAAAKDTSWVQDFSLQNVAWRVTVKPHEIPKRNIPVYANKPRRYVSEDDEEPATVALVLELVEPGCVVELERLDAQLLGLGQCLPAEHKDVTFSTTQRNAAPVDKALCCVEHGTLPRPRQFNSGLSPGTALPDDCLELRIEMRPTTRPSFPNARPLPPGDPQQTLHRCLA